ncbi:DUF6438 domain-containing protein [Mucilaginibacter sp.]|uniref:DUF6438 domain-containing protein n=1 Tax=Mucilaginibacter sp. TaxID=1882438 RepID=UPI0035BC153D
MKWICCIGVSFLLSGCIPADRLKSVSVAVGYCPGACGLTAVEIKRSLDYHYYGDNNAVLKGYYEGRFPERDWQQLESKIQQINLIKLQPTRGRGGEEKMIELIITEQGQSTHLKCDYPNLPNVLKPLVNSLLESNKTVKLTKMSELYPFRTNFQDPETFGKPNRDRRAPANY